MRDDDNQLVAWREEQRIVAASTFIPCNSSFATDQNIDIVRGENTGRYKHCTINSQLFAENKRILIGGVDVAFHKHKADQAIAAYVILSYSNFNAPPSVIYRSHQIFAPPPYISSFLSFRESPPLLSLITEQLKSHPQCRPDVIMVDGNGMWHERRAGLACFIGRCGIPCIGIGKTWYSLNGRTIDVRKAVERSTSALYYWFDEIRVESLSLANGRCVIFDSSPFADTDLVSMHSEPPAVAMEEMFTRLSSLAYGFAIPMFGETSSKNEVLAYALLGHGGHLTRHGKRGCRGSKNPIYISIGNNITLQDAVVLVAYACGVSRVPEPVREADAYGRSLLS